MRVTKQQIYAKYGIKYDSRTEKIESPIGWINPVLVKGNRKIGPKTYHFSTLPGNKEKERNTTHTHKGAKQDVKRKADRSIGKSRIQPLD